MIHSYCSPNGIAYLAAHPVVIQNYACHTFQQKHLTMALKHGEIFKILTGRPEVEDGRGFIVMDITTGPTTLPLPLAQSRLWNSAAKLKGGNKYTQSECIGSLLPSLLFRSGVSNMQPTDRFGGSHNDYLPWILLLIMFLYHLKSFPLCTNLQVAFKMM